MIQAHDYRRIYEQTICIKLKTIYPAHLMVYSLTDLLGLLKKKNTLLILESLGKNKVDDYD